MGSDKVTTQDRIQFHSERAAVELDMALRAGSVPAAKAHFSLSALHLERVGSLREAEPQPAISTH